MSGRKMTITLVEMVSFIFRKKSLRQKWGIFFPKLGLVKSKCYFLIIYNPIYGHFKKFAGRALSGKLGQHPVLTRKGNIFEKKSTKNLKNQCMELL